MLCTVCTDILQGHKPPTEHTFHDSTIDSWRYTHHVTVQGVAESASNGCYICQQIWSNMGYPAIGQPRIQDTPNSTVVDTGTTLSLRQKRLGHPVVRLTILYENSDGQPRSNDFVLQPLSSFNGSQYDWLSAWEGRSPLTKGYEMSDTSSEESLERAQTWINECVSSHSRCNRNRRSTWLPTRLLDVEGELPTSHIRVVCTADEPVEGRYITLSHCWGKTPFIQLLKSNLEQFKRKIPFSDLPKTFQDTVHVARSFGIRYVWIDSLCIIQDKDDLSDWYREAALMGKVYSHAHCNIAASAASDSSKGLFMSRDSSVLQPIVVDCYVEQELEGSGLVPCLLTSDLYWNGFIDRSPLHQRSWVFQERLLAPRVLHFAQVELAWECHELEATETYPYGLPDALWGVTTYETFSKRIIFDDRSWQSYSDLGRNDPWDIIAASYLKTSITIPTDKLVALSGVAKKVRDILSDEYIAGMWLKTLPYQLLWHITYSPDYPLNGNLLSLEDRPTTDDIRPYVAPTWSWASMTDGNLHCPIGHYLWLMIEGIQMKHATEDTTGAILGGHIDLKSFLVPCTIPFDPVIGPMCEFEHGFYNVNTNGILPDEPLDTDDLGATADDSANMVQRTRLSPIAREKKARKWSVRMDRPTRLHRSLDVWCLLGSNFDMYWDFLILRVVDSREGVFQRIGIARTQSLFTSNSDNLSHEERVAIEFRAEPEVARTYPCRKYVEEEGKHTVRII